MYVLTTSTSNQNQMILFKNIFTATVAKGLCLLALIGVITSCESIYTDRSDCPVGVSLYFRYDHNMEFANSLHKQNDCLTVYVYDSEGYLVTTQTETSDVLADEDYHMDLNLPMGNYKIIAYGGMSCERSSFTLSNNSATSTSENMSDNYVELNHNRLTSNKQLHNHFYGMHEVIMDSDFVQYTVYMVKNTNNIRVVLQQVQGDPLSASDFIFAITDDNTLMDYTNDVIPNGVITYSPWTKGEKIIGTTNQNDTPTSVAYAEFSTARIMAESGSKLTIFNKKSGDVILSIPLDKYLLLLKSELYSDMTAQEYLDREDEWSMMFFLDSGLRWINTHIVINDWTVRLNHIDI